MKLAIPVIGDKLTDVINERFGRAESLIIYDKGEYKVINNPAINAAGGAGVQTAQIVCDEDIQAVIAMKVGPKALDVLKAANVLLYQGNEGTVAENILAFEAKKLKKIQ